MYDDPSYYEPYPLDILPNTEYTGSDDLGWWLDYTEDNSDDDCGIEHNV